jgi:copper chaperone CopZ
MMKKKLLIPLFVFAFLFSLPFSRAETKPLSIDIKGMTCAMCAAKVESSIKKLDGVSKCVVDHKTGKGSVEFDDAKVSSDKILEACNKTGFTCRASQ